MVSRPLENASPWALRGRRVITPAGEDAAAVLVRGEKIVALCPPDQIPADFAVDDVGDRVIMPGLVDTHVHINEPGRTDWEGFETATRAAAAGGVTTLVDMPLNSSPVTTNADALAEKLAAVQGKLTVDCGFYGGVIPGNAGQIGRLIAAGVLGLKAFLCPSGIDEFPAASEADLRAALPHIAAAGLPLLVHAELVELLSADAGDPRSYAAYLASRPRHWEHNAIRLLIALCREQRSRVHVVHLSSADALSMIKNARDAVLPLTVETCPHYLFFAAEDIPDGDPRFKCAPPLRDGDNRARLWQGLRAGLIDTIGSDHSPAPPALKQLDTGDLQRAWGGISSLQLTLSAVWTAAAQHAGVTLVDVVNWMSRRPAQLVGLEGCKGSLTPGCDADIVVLAPDVEFTVKSDMLLHRHKITPYEGRVLRGRIETTYLRGRKIYDQGRFADQPSGRPVLRRGA